jgi:hypothetical protein
LFQAKSPKAPASQGGSLEELEVLPEEEAVGGDEDREKELLMERIQSIKEEKQVPPCPSASVLPACGPCPSPCS